MVRHVPAARLPGFFFGDERRDWGDGNLSGAANKNAADQHTADGSWAEILTGRLGLYTFIINLGVTLFGINLFVVATVMPTVVADLGGVNYYTWAFSLFTVGAIIGAAGAGPLRDATGVRAAYVGAGLMLALGLVGSALATSMLGLVGWRFLQGLGGGAISSLAYALVASIFPPRLQARELSIVSAIWGIATVGGPGVGALFATPSLWRWAFWLLAALTLVFALLAWRYIAGEKGHGEWRRIPYSRLALLALAVLIASATSLTLKPMPQLTLFAIALVLTATAFIRDARAERNIFPRQATVVTTDIGATYWVFFLVSVVLAFVNTYTTFYLQRLHGIHPFTAGYLFCIQSLMWTISALFVTGVRPAMLPLAVAAGVVLVLVSAIMIALAVDSGPVAVIALGLVVSGVGMGFLNNPAIQHIINVAPAAERNSAGASLQAVRNIGLSFGAASAGMVAASAGLVDNAPREVVAAAMRSVYAVNIAVGGAALAVAAGMVWRGRGKI